MGLYATVGDVNSYIPGGSGLTDPELEKVIEAASRDIDRASGYRGWDEATGLFFTPGDLSAPRATGLSRAVAAQVEYRLTKGEQFFIEAQRPSQADQTREPRVGPKAIEELSAVGLRVTTGIMR